MEYITIINRRLNIMMAVIIVCAVILAGTMVFYRPATKFNPDATDALEDQRQALVQQRASFEKMVAQANENIIYFNKRDSLLNNQFIITANEIKKIRNNDKIISISRYNSADLTRAFAALEK